MKTKVLTACIAISLTALPVFAQTGGHEQRAERYASHPSSPAKTRLWALTCWQGGVEIINEHGLTDFTNGTTSYSATLQKDGKIYVSGLDQHSGTVCQVIEYER
jgi:hypothetical protein